MFERLLNFLKPDFISDKLIKMQVVKFYEVTKMIKDVVKPTVSLLRLI